MKYRAEIDGLRAVAIIPVILFHAGFGGFSGGFVGVDIFFVISGYLITTIILSEKERGVFSLINFYDRRARRILPALFLVMFVSIIFSWFWLLPSDMQDFSKSLVAVSLFSSNILFWQETGYWGVENELKPLLHTWSLAVEEQYYVIFPIFLMLMWRFKKRWILSSFVFFAVISLMVAQWAAYNKPTANFFLLPTRAWELAIGAGIAFYFLYKKDTIRTLLSYKIIDEILGVIGLILIVYSVVSFNESVPFPSLFALIPTIGAGLIILFSSKNTLVGRVLGAKFFVGIGLISYSAYLWHQPLFAFARHRSLTEPNDFIFSVLAIISFILAYISWKYIEEPFRRKGLFNRKQIFVYGIIGSIAFITFGLVGYYTNGFLFKNELSKGHIEKRLKVNHGLSKKCGETFLLSSECRTSEEPEILIWGDSYAMQLVSGILASKNDAKIIQMTKSICGPFFDVAPVTSSPEYSVKWAKDCLGFTESVRGWIKKNKTVKYVVVSSHFNNYLIKGHRLLYRDNSIEHTNTDAVTKEFINTLDELKSMGLIPIVFSSAPANGFDLGRCLAKAETRGLDLDACNFDLKKLTQDRKDEYYFLDEIKKKYRVVRLDDLICKNDECQTHIDSTWLFRDKGHLSRLGSASLGSKYDFYKKIIDNP